MCFTFQIGNEDHRTSPNMQTFFLSENNYIILMNIPVPGCYKATVTNDGAPLRNSNLTIIVLTGEKALFLLILDSLPTILRTSQTIDSY